jgi:hypothetical protein
VHTGRSWLCLPAATLTVARNWASSSGKLAVYSSSTMHIYSNLKTCRLLIAPWLADVARACFAIGYYPRLGRSITTVILRKKGKADYSILGSYRPIALESTLSKILEKVIAGHMADIVEEHALLL